MGLWDKAKHRFKELSRTDEYDDDYARQFTKDAKHDIEPGALRKQIGGNVPLDYLNDDEQLQYFFIGLDLDIDGDDEGMNTAFIVTEKRLVFLAQSVTAKSSQYTVTYSDIIGVSTQKRVMTQIQVETAGHSYKISVGGNKHQLGESAASYIQQRKEKAGKDSENKNETSPLDEIDKLDELRQKGAISEDEYEEKKQELLDKL